MLIGPPGTGKTTSLKTLVEAGLQTRVVHLDPGGGVITGTGVKQHYRPYTAPSWNTLRKVGEMTRSLGLNDNSLAAMGRISGEGQDFTEFLDLIDLLRTYVDPETGEQLGDVSEFGTDTVLGIDGLTGLAKDARYLVAGPKPSLTWPEFNAAQQNISMLSDICTLRLGCHFVLICHVEMQKDDITGRIFWTPSAIGKALGPVLPANYNDVILAWKGGKGEYGWATIADGFDLKHTYLDDSAELPPSFVPLVEEWKRRGGILSPEPWRAPVGEP